jgi:hypothetical protein
VAGRVYTDAEVREILRRVVERGRRDRLSRGQLIAAAEELGANATAVDAALMELEARDDETATQQLQRRHKLASRFATWGIVSAGLFGIDWGTGGGWWFYWPVAIWGIVLLRHVLGVVFAGLDDRDHARQHLH